VLLAFVLPAPALLVAGAVVSVNALCPDCFEAVVVALALAAIGLVEIAVSFYVLVRVFRSKEPFFSRFAVRSLAVCVGITLVVLLAGRFYGVEAGTISCWVNEVIPGALPYRSCYR
jgi:hypothetical protein